MQPYHWILIAIGVFIAVAIINNLLNPPRELPWDEVPVELRQVFEESLPGFEITTVRFVPAVHEYKIRGRYRDRAAKAELECGPKGDLYEIEYEDARPSVFLHPRDSEMSEIPGPAREHLLQLLGPEQASFEPTRVASGSAHDKPAFKIEGRSKNWKWEFEFLADGQLLELEKGLLHRL